MADIGRKERRRHDVQAGYDFSLADKVAVVTGGASGIGSAIVDAYAAKGATVVVLDKDLEAAQRKVSEGSAAAAFGCDVTSEQSVVEAISTVSRSSSAASTCSSTVPALP